MSFTESTGAACSESVSHNQVHVLSIPVLLLDCSQDWIWNLQLIVSLEGYDNRYVMYSARQYWVNFWNL